MEKIRLVNNRGKVIVANDVSNGSETIIVLAHGFTNDKSSDGRFDRLVAFLEKQNVDTLAFDFSGSGESDDDALTAKNQAEDMSAVLEYVYSKKYKQIILFGNSFGTLACMRNYSNKITTMILLGAVTDAVYYDWDEFFSEDELKMLESEGSFQLRNERKHVISHETLRSFEEINQAELLRDIKCPVLIIHGNNAEDEEELELLENSQRAISLLSDESKLEVIEGAKHGFHDNWDDVISLTWNWISKLV